MDLLGKRQTGHLTRGGPRTVAADSEATLSWVDLKSIRSIVDCCHCQNNSVPNFSPSSTRYLRSWRSGKRKGEVGVWLVRAWIHLVDLGRAGRMRCLEDGYQHPQPQPWLTLWEWMERHRKLATPQRHEFSHQVNSSASGYISTTAINFD